MYDFTSIEHLASSIENMSIFLERQEVRKRRAWGSVLKRAERISLSIMVVLVGLGALYGLYILIFLGPYFAINDIVIKGHWKQLDARSLIEISGVKQGDNLFLLNVGEVHDRIMMNPWVKEVAVRRHLPHTLWIAVEENTPRAIMIKPDGMHYVDHDGIMFKMIDSHDKKDYPFISGVVDYAGMVGGFEEGQDQLIHHAMNIMDAMESSKLGKKYGVSEIHYDAVRGFSVITEKGSFEVLLGLDDPVSKVGRLDQMAKAVFSRGRRVRYILADEPGRVIVRYRGVS